MANLASESYGKPDGLATDMKGKYPDNTLELMSQNAGKRIGNMAAGFTKSGSEYIRSGRAYVRENPTKGIAIATAFGAVAGSLLTMAMRSSRK